MVNQTCNWEIAHTLTRTKHIVCIINESKLWNVESKISGDKTNELDKRRDFSTKKKTLCPFLKFSWSLVAEKGTFSGINKLTNEVWFQRRKKKKDTQLFWSLRLFFITFSIKQDKVLKFSQRLLYGVYLCSYFPTLNFVREGTSLKGTVNEEKQIKKVKTYEQKNEIWIKKKYLEFSNSVIFTTRLYIWGDSKVTHNDIKVYLILVSWYMYRNQALFNRQIYLRNFDRLLHSLNDNVNQLYH